MIARRSFIAALLFLLFPASLNAHIEQLGPNYYVAGVPSGQFQYSVAPEVQGRQRQANWCWAACVQMVLNFHGIGVDQEQVVSRIFGNQMNQPATSEQLLYALNAWSLDYRGRFSVISSTPYILNDSEVIDDLAHCWPLIVGLQNGDETGHTYVLTALYFSVDRYNRPIFDKVILRDPWPTKQSKQEWSWASVHAKLSFTARIRVSRL